MNTVIKMEPRDEPIELTNASRSEMYNQPMVSQPLNIPTIIPMSQNPGRPLENHYEEDKRMDRHERDRTERLERPERIDRPERTDLGGMGTPIGKKLCHFFLSLLHNFFSSFLGYRFFSSNTFSIFDFFFSS